MLKLFAKRTRKVVEKNSSTEEAVENAEKDKETDKRLQELLEKDVKALNAKERRLVKRYHERRAEEKPKGEKSIESPSSFHGEKSIESPCSFHEHEKEKEYKRAQNGSDFPEAELSAKDGVSAGSDALDQKIEPTAEETKISEGEKVNDGVVEKISVNFDTNERKGFQEFEELLQKLNSKQRRKLTRELEQTGNVEGIRQKLHELLELKVSEYAAPQAESNKKRSVSTCDETTTMMESAGKRHLSKKRRKMVNENDLSAEERLRREEQRRLQKEAAERRSAGGDDPASSPAGKRHRHPLNSERRRANRRKPKWVPRRQQSSQNGK